jgi:nicotinate-nucleotide adenylyltransferase
MTRTLLYGGTFDPPHIAHVHIPHKAMVSLEFDRVLYVPANVTPLKEASSTPVNHRLAMLQLALNGCEWAEISTIEIERGGQSYTIDTIESLQNEGDELRLLIGADQWVQFEQWKRWEDIIRLANPVIMPRDEFDVCDERLLQIDSLPAVSSDIRHRIATGDAIDDLVPPKVAAYITQHQLYQ